MSTATVRSGFDTWAGSGHPDRENYATKTLSVMNATARAYLYFKNPAPRGAVVTRATLSLRVKGSLSGSRTITAHRITESWKVQTLNWNKQPAIASSGASTATLGAVSDGYVLQIDVTNHVQAVVNGSPNYGWRIVTSDANRHYFYGLDSDKKPTLEVVWSDAPAKPTTLKPSDGVVGIAFPILQCDYTDVSGNVSLASVQVQIDPAKSTTAPAFDSGEVASTEPQIDLAQTSFAGLAEGATTYWRIRVKDGGGLWSPWSDWHAISRAARAAVTIQSPGVAPNDYVAEFTPPIIWAFPGQTAWQVRVTPADDQQKILYDSGKRLGTENSHTIPEGVLKDGVRYSVNVRAWDGNLDRVAAPNDPIYSRAWADFSVAYDATVDPVSGLTAVQDDVTPWVILTWTRATAPDSFTVLRDGKVVRTDLAPADLLQSGTTYSWKDHGADPHVEHDYRVLAVVNRTQSPKGPSATITTAPEGVWLVDFDRDVWVTLWGDDEGTWDMYDDAATYRPLGSTEIVRVVGGMGGLEGTWSGLLMEGFRKTFESMEADLYAIKERPSQTVRMVVGDVNMKVLIGNLKISPSARTKRGQLVKNVSFDFWQVGDLPFEPRI